MGALEIALIDEAHRLGFGLCGIAAATDADGFDRLREWLDRGYAGEMTYLSDQPELRRHPRSVYPQVRSVIMVAMSYAPGRPALKDGSMSPSKPGEPGCLKDETHGETNASAAAPFTGLVCLDPSLRAGRIARYARGPDYHAVLRGRLKALGEWLKQQRPGCWGRSVVDTAPLLERDFARRAGLGWFGKNTMLLNKRLGSWTVLGALLVDVELQPSTPFTQQHCGTCTACLDACPTQAFDGPYRLDARKCISYLTIELKSSIPDQWRPAIGDWVFGCDICNDVCPWNRRAPAGVEALAQREDLESVDLVELLGLSPDAFRQRFAGTAMHPRPGRAVILRNAALALGNVGDETALSALRHALDDEPLIAEAARWAIERIQRRAGSLACSEEATGKAACATKTGGESEIS